MHSGAQIIIGYTMTGGEARTPDYWDTVTSLSHSLPSRRKDKIVTSSSMFKFCLWHFLIYNDRLCDPKRSVVEGLRQGKKGPSKQKIKQNKI